MADMIQSVGPALQALSQQFDTITQNLANTSTIGYKRARTSLVQSLTDDMAAGAPAGSVTGLGGIDFSPGSLAQTGAPLDLAIEGKGFFVIETPQGKRYTRNGSFRLGPTGQLVDSLGEMVGGEDGALTIPPGTPVSKISVSRDGVIMADKAKVGKLSIVDFTDPKVLQNVGGGFFTAPSSADPITTKAVLHQGYQESSNVNGVEELVGLITVSRMYEANIHMLQTNDDGSKNLLKLAME